MKNIIKPLIALFAIFTIASCSTDDVEDRPVITAKDAPVLSAPGAGSAYTLIIENAATQAERFVWTSASFDQNVAINYEVQLDAVGNEFATPHSLGSVIGENQLSVSVETLNAAVMTAGGIAFTEGSFEVRVKASVNDIFEPLYSNVTTISVTPYVVVVPPLFLVGAPQGYYGLNQWDNTTAMPMRYIGNGTTKIYEGYLKVNSGEGFKFIGQQGTWDNGNFGTVGGVQNGNLENSGSSGDIKIAETDGPGLYYVWVDIDNLQYKSIKMNWGIIGAATPGGWDNETPMTFDFANNKYTLSTTLTAGDMKFRAKNAANITGGTDDWKFNVGVSNPTVVYNTASTNLTATAGTHNIELHINFDGTATYSGL